MGNTNKNKEYLEVVTQAFYGNRVSTEIKKENFDRFMLGYLDSSISLLESDKIDRTIVKVPNTENLVIVYNKYREEKRLLEKENNHKIKPLAVISELGIEIYSRCIVCRMNENGELESLQDGDYKKFEKYLAE